LLIIQFANQGLRHYATEAPKGGSNLPIFAGIGIVAAAGGYYYLNQTGAVPSVKEAPKPAGPAKPVFTGGDQDFVDLKLAAVEKVNHNTKRFRFEFPEGDENVSGLHIACM
jgi:cytochrome-b5 reductase